MARILVLDDLPDAVFLVEKTLKAKGHDVIGFTDEQQALVYARSNVLDLLILDIKLKKLNGIEVLEEMKKLNASLKAIILTGYPTLETARRAKELGALEYCVKPLENDELEEVVARVLGPAS